MEGDYNAQKNKEILQGVLNVYRQSSDNGGFAGCLISGIVISVLLIIGGIFLFSQCPNSKKLQKDIDSPVVKTKIMNIDSDSDLERTLCIDDSVYYQIKTNSETGLYELEYLGEPIDTISKQIIPERIEWGK